MPLILVRKSNEAGVEQGPMLINTDHIVTAYPGTGTSPDATTVLTADGRTHWVKDTLEELHMKT
jgi:hypothetical protein